MTTPQPPQQPQAPYGYPQQPGPYQGPYQAPPAAPQGNPYGAPPQGNPYGAPPQSNPYGTAAPQAHPYGTAAPQGNPYGAPGPYAAPPQQPGPGGPYAGVPQQPGPYGAAPHQQPHPQPGAHGGCQICGGFPAVQTTIRRHQGLVFLMRFYSQKGRFCRTCGTALLREMTAKTCWQWWSPFSLIIFTPLTLLWNLSVHAKLKKLTPPAPGSHGPQPDPGAPLFSRPGAIGLIGPVGWWVVLAAQIVLHL
ncbi:hypothetical protein J7W19_10680 [Streptomyces mobaraensis NBRC 13819 = DSM 40847]|uniref:Uncharacterized protein n=1 Tax=Streptomyces mobaraensis (strain ATCC 29032 / DSM 40847 / JCM 4168 / NBRC 13819 / NCIMB 11159 / IPCR 16-22) TaxID=1223523 RepID=M2ZWS8_STRM1|nr:hypothetical protein [Streptomyces mobaraensis]EME97178.1 hypothetical protein H340_27746 [Streptomyces mobaraensis NBRC 13819 = DSM 40847]QTT73822.1 hypothetical protein J7W19_10680 [Streptomyces mobaraensis NBRC 13819 = DSM 40847]